MCPLRVFWVYKQVAGSGDVVIEEQRFSIFNTHEPAVTMPLSSLWICLQTMDTHSCRNQIFLEGGRRGVRRFVSPGL